VEFDAGREGGIGLPLIGKNSSGDSIGGAGIMQLYKPPSFILRKLIWLKS